MSAVTTVRAVMALTIWALMSSMVGAETIEISGLLTAGEKAARLAEFEAGTMPSTRTAAGRPVSLITDEIRRAQGAEPYFRRPVPYPRLRALQRRLQLETGRTWPIDRVAAAVDYTHAHMRESRKMAPSELGAKLQRDLAMERKAFHGQIAEIAEARERRMLLTKDTRSQTYDLTEDRPRPRSLQLKVLQDADAGLRQLQADLADADPRARHGVLARQEVEQLVRSGKLRLKGEAGGHRIYTTTVGPRITVLPSRALESVASSQIYARTGRAAVATLLKSGLFSGMVSRVVAASGVVAVPLVMFDAYGHGSEALTLILDPDSDSGVLPLLHLTIALGHTAEAATLLWMTGSEFAVLGLESVTLFELAASEVFLPVAVVVQGLKFGLAFYEYSSGRIGWDQFRDRATGPGLFVVFTGAGAAICSVVPVAGTITCAVGGAILSFPVSFWDRHYRAKKRQAFEKEIFHLRVEALEDLLSGRARSLGM